MADCNRLNGHEYPQVYWGFKGVHMVLAHDGGPGGGPLKGKKKFKLPPNLGTVEQKSIQCV